MKKTYESPELEIVLFEDSVICDIINDSNIGEGDEEERFFPIYEDEDM